MPKKITFNKYQQRAADYHWQQIGRNIFKLNSFVLARYQQVVALVPKKDHLKILDIGCGDGVLLSLIKRGRLFGVDPDQDSLGAAQKKVAAKFIKAKAEKLPFKNSFFDVVIATEIIEHLRQPEKLLSEANRVLKRGGRLILTTPVKQPEGLTDKLHYREFTPKELKQLCRQYFKSVQLNTSHPVWLKKIYTKSLGRISCYHFDLWRWLINSIVIITNYNPFVNLPGKPSQQIIMAKK